MPPTVIEIASGTTLAPQQIAVEHELSMLKQPRPQRLRDADELVPELRKLRHRRRLVLVDAQVVRERISIMISHLVAIEVDLEAEAVLGFGAVDAARCRAALLHITRIFLAFSLLRPVLTLRVLVLTKRVGRGERERRERRDVPLHGLCLARCGGVRATSDLLYPGSQRAVLSTRSKQLQAVQEGVVQLQEQIDQILVARAR